MTDYAISQNRNLLYFDFLAAPSKNLEMLLFFVLPLAERVAMVHSKNNRYWKKKFFVFYFFVYLLFMSYF